MADPRGARALAQQQLADTGRTDPATIAAAHRVLGLAARELQDAALAAVHLRRAIGIAARHGLGQLAGESRMSLALVLDDLGRPAAAIREIDRAMSSLSGLPLARARMQRGILLRRLGRESEALDAYGAALASFRRHGDQLWQARALTNRGVLQAYRGALGQARADLGRSEALYRSLDLPAAVAQVQHNLGFVAAQGGDVPTALHCYDQADTYFRRHGRPAVALIDRAELLLAARLLPEARQAATDAVAAAQQARLGSLLAQAQLLLAQTALAAGDHAAALPAARSARRAFERQSRHRWAVHARYLEMRASQRVHRLIGRRLIETGWPEQALEAWLDTAAIPELAAATARPPRGPARLRIRAWHARALVRLNQGDRIGAKRALIVGLRLLDEYRAALGATELRILSSAEGAELAALGLRLSMQDGNARQVLAWAERWRAATLCLRPTPPQHDADLVRDVAQLRRVGAELATDSADPVRHQRLLRRQRALEDALRRRTWRTAGAEPAAGAAVPAGRIVESLGGQALLELVERDGVLYAVTAVAGRVRLTELVVASDVDREVGALRFAMRRLVLRHGSAASQAAAATGAALALERLDRWLIEPVLGLIGGRDLVVVPTGGLHALPWPALAHCRDRSVTVAPSATAWWRAARGRSGGGPMVLVAASTPEHAIDEVSAIAGLTVDAVVLTGARATAQATLTALDGAGVAHVAAHGAFRSDNPLFSHLRMADGPLTVHDLAALHRPPELIILSACDTGLSAVHPGDELMGLAATLLSTGTRALVASVGPVDDELTVSLMVELHRQLAKGLSPAGALASAQAVHGDRDWVTTRSFVCFGAG